MSSYTVISYSAHDLPKEYRAMIYAKWMRSLRYGNDYFKLTDPDAFFSAYQKYITEIMARINTVVRLAVLTDLRDVVLGFSVTRGDILDYVHVHANNRRLGIGTKLLPPGIETITHLTRTGLTIWGSKYLDWTFNPFA